MMKLIISSFICAVTLTACMVPVEPNSVVVPLVIHENTAKQANTPVYVCTIKPFMDTYRSENINRGKAKLAVQKQCLEKHNAMFCEEKDIVCKVYE
ncbi:hypothetical protein [Wielerella bovis]|uniref:hypothetical protein n=1 Tax=Wielerella bovis TaxID=2917790 RepID=UPI00201982C3|nr:hypothetical protein [Wielerella bovis]ULJ66739.1 hypothetical protein MIS31_10960 [Wielerella bovis]